MYKLVKNVFTKETNQVQRLEDKSFIPFDPANTDYQQFKKDLEAGVQLQDAEGTVMTSEQIQQFIATLP
jgi:hypothetical protein